MAFSTGMLPTKLRNRITAAGAVQDMEFEFKLRTIMVNGNKLGTSGFVKNVATGKVVYVKTEVSAYGPLSSKVLYRVARDFSDYAGMGYNQWGEVRDDGFVHDIVRELGRP